MLFKTKVYYAPDPSSQIACSIGGNDENSGGVHSQIWSYYNNRYSVLMDGTVTKFGGKAMDAEDMISRLDDYRGFTCYHGYCKNFKVTVVKAALVGFPSIEDAETVLLK